jgi:hypothetical protein
MRRMKLYLGLMVVALAIVGVAGGLLVARPARTIIPAGQPVISAESYWHMAGHKGRLFVYENGDLLYIEDTGLRIPTPDRPAVRTWNAGHLGVGQLDGLLRLLGGNEFKSLNDSYMYDGNPSSDLWYTLVVSLPDLARGVKANIYLSPDRGETYPGMPHPLDEIYAALRSVTEKNVKVVATEKIRG